MKRILIGSLIAGVLMMAGPAMADSYHRNLPPGNHKQMGRDHHDHGRWERERHYSKYHDRRHGHKHKHKHKHKGYRDRHYHDDWKYGRRDGYRHDRYRHGHYDGHSVEHRVANIVHNTRELIEMNRR